MEAKSQNQEQQMTRDQLMMSILVELKGDVKEFKEEFRADMKEILKKQSEQDKEIDRLKWKSGIISLVAGFVSGLGGKFTDIFH